MAGEPTRPLCAERACRARHRCRRLCAGGTGYDLSAATTAAPITTKRPKRPQQQQQTCRAGPAQCSRTPHGRQDGEPPGQTPARVDKNCKATFGDKTTMKRGGLACVGSPGCSSHVAMGASCSQKHRSLISPRSGFSLLKLATVRPAEGAPGPTWWAEWDYSQTHLRIDGA